MLKNDKGISLVTLIVTIVVMIILISIIVNSSLDSVEEANVTKINNEIKNLKDAVVSRITDNARNESLYPIVGEPLGDSVFENINSINILTLDEKAELIEKVSKSYNEETKDYFRKVGKNEAETLGVEGISSDHYYIINYYDCEVYGPIDLNIVSSGG